MQNLGVEETIQKNRKSKFEIEKELQKSITNQNSDENTEMQEKVKKFMTINDAAKLVQEFEQIIKN